MTKQDLTDELARVLEMSHKQAKLVLDAILDSMVRALRRGETVQLRGFGSFGTHQRGAGIGRNPETGARVEVPARRVPHFKAAKELKELVNQGTRETILR